MSYEQSMGRDGESRVRKAGRSIDAARDGSESEDVVQVLRDRLVQALAGAPDRVVRLSHADTTVRFALDDSDRGTTLLLDRDPPVIAEDDAPAEVEIVLSAEQMRAFAAGSLPMPAQLVSGTIHTSGPVRRYLEADPILRSLLERHAPRTDAATLSATASSTNGGPPTDLWAIETKDLHKSFGTNHVLRGMNLTIPEGVVSVVLGPSGTGKSVVLQHIIGSMRPDRGEVTIRGRSLAAMSRSELMMLRRGIGVMYQDGALFSSMNVYDNVAFPLRQHTDLRPSEVDEVVMGHLGSVGLASAAKRMPNELSGGMKKRAGLARALALDPGIILCDEPDSGLDPVRTRLLGELLIEQHAASGGTMVVVTHNVLLARSVSEHISVLWRGQVLEAGLAEQVLQSKTPFVEQFLAGNPEGPLTMDA